MSKKKETADVTTSLESLESGNKVDRIRDIVFGAQMREYNQRFDTIGRDVARIQQELSQVNEQLTVQLRQLGTQIQELDKRLSDKIQENGKQLGGRLDELEQQQSGRVRDLDNRLAQELKDQEDRIGQRIQELNQFATGQLDQLQQQLRHTGEEIRLELRENADQLTNAKVERTTLGQLLIELGANLQAESNGGMFDQLLDELADEIDG